MELSDTKRGNRTPIWIAGGCLAILICGLGVFLFGFGGLYWLGTQFAEEVSVNWNLPSAMTVGEDIKFDIAISNITAAPVDLFSIDFSTNYLQGVLIEATTPLYVNVFEYTAWGGGEVFQSYSFKQSIPPGEPLLIAFNGRAVMSGDYTGTIVVCINSAFNCKTNVLRTIIK